MTELPPTFDERLYVRIDQGMPENRKIVGLPDAAFRLYVESVCWCARQRTDGALPTAVLRKRGKRAADALVAARLVEPSGDGWKVHDYLMHQRSADEIDKIHKGRSDAGAYGAHVRWHLATRTYSEDCAYCKKDGLVPP